ncbi:hypothetical protein [Halobacillus mangrovi]|uniref:Uncharacterized protein n=1 Tax=Halobacillus mangrovi TaxID=402384 RepID=A0A1W5ZU24_9BACI|nr:hypothetical protein [Halobacillus mangrovi]ARI76757.1 hypothetical protein HM131_07830 [Halobacillus mangrovi]
MAQLIKLQDYISRYETSIYQYPSQFIRLKRENWSKFQHLFEQGLLEEDVEELEGEVTAKKSKGISRLFEKSSPQLLMKNRGRF